MLNVKLTLRLIHCGKVNEQGTLITKYVVLRKWVHVNIPLKILYDYD